MRFLVQLLRGRGKGHGERSTALAYKRHHPSQLFRQHPDELEPKGLDVSEIEVLGEAMRYLLFPTGRT